MTFRALPILFALLLPGLAQAACADLAYRQFDFMLGDWNVATADGKLIGHDHLEKAYGGCVLQEHWTGAGGSVGSSFNIYDPVRKLWHQTWVDNGGALLEIEGGMQGGSMVMRGRRSGTGPV